MRQTLRYIVIPDIHGHYSIFYAVEAFIKKIWEDQPQCRVVFLGDYVDRGESETIEDEESGELLHYNDLGSVKVALSMMALRQYALERDYPLFIIRGNHEESFIEHVRRLEQDGSGHSLQESWQRTEKDLQAKLRNTSGCAETALWQIKDLQAYANTLKGFRRNMELMSEVKAFFSSLSYFHYFKEDGLFFVHAGVDPTVRNAEGEIALEAMPKEKYVENGEKFYNYSGRYPAMVITGHTAIDTDRMRQRDDVHHGILVRADRMILDSGVYLNKYLNVLCITNSQMLLYKATKEGLNDPIVLNEAYFKVEQ